VVDEAQISDVASFRLDSCPGPVSSTQTDLFIGPAIPTSAFMAKPVVLSRCVSRSGGRSRKLRIKLPHHRGNARLGHGRVQGLTSTTLDGGRRPRQ